MLTKHKNERKKATACRSRNAAVSDDDEGGVGAMEKRLSEVSEVLEPATRTAGLLPTSTDLDFYCSIDPGVKQALDGVSSDLDDVLSTMTAWMGSERQSMDSMMDAASFSAQAGETIDRLLERTDVYLDEYAGRRPIAPKDEPVVPSTGKLPKSLLFPKIPKPQDAFSRRPDNRACAPWTRQLRFGKPNARVPLGWRDPAWDMPEHATVEGQYGTEGDARLNAYYVEIQQTPIPASAYRIDEPRAPEPLDLDEPDASLAWVDSLDKLHALAAHLEEARVTEIAIDLEHHSHRTYLGLVCLMQISTRWGDWIVDTLVDEVREHAEMLNASFTHPDKVLVLHGADHDILWLQRDLGLFVTNLFDTFQAARVLQFGSLSLAYLLLRYTGFEADKRFQTADWRIRPLPREMLFYARSDTHSLLYVYDCLRLDLERYAGHSAITDVFERSKATASKTYIKVPWDAQGDSRNGWRTLWLRLGGDLARAAQDAPPGTPLSREERILRRLHQWRDEKAREDDERPAFVLSDEVLISLALRPPLTLPEAHTRTPMRLRKSVQRMHELVDAVKAEWEAYQAGLQPSMPKTDVAVDEDLGERYVGDEEGWTEAGVQVGVWDAQAPQSRADAQLFRGLHVSSQAAPSTKRKSLFEMPSARTPSHAAATLRRIQSEFVQRLGSLVGRGPERAGEPEEPEVPVKPEGPVDEKPVDEKPVEPEDAAPIPPEAHETTVVKHDRDKDDDGIVRVSKHIKVRAPKTKKSQAAPVPFDYAQATSVLDAPRSGSEASLLAPTKAAAEPRGARPKNLKRSGQRSGTFARRNK